MNTQEKTDLVQPGRRWVAAQSLTESGVYQPDKELSVDIGDSATLQCCISENVFGVIAWFKQPNRKKPQIIVRVYKTAGDTFYSEFQKSHFQIERSSNCFNLIILNIIQSDEAMYYCALTDLMPVFADGTYLKIKGEHVTIESETSKPALGDNSVGCEPTLHGNSINMNTQEKTVLGLGTALGLCALLIFCLIYFILRRRKWDKMNTSIEDSKGMNQVRESEAESLNYAALKFSKRKPKAGKKKTDSSDECVYADIQSNPGDAGLLHNPSQSQEFISLIKSSSDEAMYYCALTDSSLVFADGTYLKIKGEHVTIESETSKPALGDNSVGCEPTLHGNSTNMNTQKKTEFEISEKCSVSLSMVLKLL
ncbi:uncharacterized protein LOC132890352 [Neoarius graeffei]|uniref:uncharacterized protein LOC132890352 n=1 Tax=Neoarius graeffei TaxID=443677 RepID=UPI00298D1C30|nr:uncharacterized protein LOC132890352 [Neoarius graeffei]